MTGLDSGGLFGAPVDSRRQSFSKGVGIMSTLKRVTLILALIITMGALVNASAQTRATVQSKGKLATALANTSTEVTFNGFEITEGLELMSPTGQTNYYGWVCAGRTSGALPGNMTLSFNAGPDDWELAGAGEIYGGTWTLPVYGQTISGTQYMGMLYGEVTEGKLTMKYAGLSRNFWYEYYSANLKINGGTQQLLGVTGSGVLNLVMPQDLTQPDMKNLTGSIIFYF
jgi:hypothetical protein